MAEEDVELEIVSQAYAMRRTVKLIWEVGETCLWGLIRRETKWWRQGAEGGERSNLQRAIRFGLSGAGWSCGIGNLQTPLGVYCL
jgi:hypothetical protein